MPPVGSSPYLRSRCASKGIWRRLSWTFVISPYLQMSVRPRRKILWQTLPSCLRAISISKALNSSDTFVLASAPIFSPAHCFTLSSFLLIFIFAGRSSQIPRGCLGYLYAVEIFLEELGGLLWFLRRFWWGMLIVIILGRRQMATKNNKPPNLRNLSQWEWLFVNCNSGEKKKKKTTVR